MFFILASLDCDANDLAEQLYLQYHKAVYRYHFGKLSDKDSAEYATTDTFIRVIQNIDTLMTLEEENIKRNIFGYARLSCLDIMRKRKKESHMNAFSVSNAQKNDNDELFDDDIASSCNIISEVIQNEALEHLVKAIKKLDERAQQIVMYKIYFDNKNSEIAKKMGLNPSTVGTILQRSLKILRRELEDYING
ncbi:MAG: RNA polymerase sigma factor [Ruminococcaceae bacterium]|nr:RNA polymerase sigma factor [Oscillospiraceae bacterium]